MRTSTPELQQQFWSYFDQHFRSFGVVAHAALHQQGPIASSAVLIMLHARPQPRSIGTPVGQRRAMISDIVRLIIYQLFAVA